MRNFAHANKGTTYTVNHYLATNILGYGVMVTLQILVLSFLVRVRVSQQSSSKEQHLFFNIGIWCNGNTTDSGPVILGSSPSIPTKQSLFFTNRLFSYSPLSHILWINPTLHPQKTNTGISDSADAACEQLYPRMSEIPVFCYYIMIALFKDILYTLL